MKIVQLIQMPQRRGAEVFATQLATALEERGHESVVIALYAPPEGASRLPLGTGGVELEARVDHPLERFPGAHPGLARRLNHHLRRLRPDIVQANGARSVKYAALAAGRRPDRRNWAFVYRNIGDPRHWVRGAARRWLYGHLVAPRLDAVAGVSRATLQAVEDFYPRLDAVTETIPNAVDPRALAPRQNRAAVREKLNTPGSAPVLLWIGRLAPEKRPDRWLRVAARVVADQPRLHLWIAGTGPLAGEVAAAVEAAGLAPRTRLLGEVEHSGDLYAAADLLLLSSDSEGMPGVTLEAAVLGLPAVATRVGGTDEAVTNEVTGLLRDPEDEAGLADAVAALLADPERRAGLAEAARRRAEEEFSMPVVAGRYEALYRRALATRGRAQ